MRDDKQNTVAHSAIPTLTQANKFDGDSTVSPLAKRCGNEGRGSNEFVDTPQGYSRMPSNMSCVIAAGCGVAAEISV